MKNLVRVLAICFCLLPALASAIEVQTIDPALDANFLSQFPNLWSPGKPVPNVFNVMVIGQDDGGAYNRSLGRKVLGSRSDIIMFVSFNLNQKRATILSIYRDHTPSAFCEQRIGRSAPDGKINGVYSIMGRRGFIPCIEGMMEELIRNAGAEMMNEFLDRGRFKVHAFFEGTRSETLTPLSKDVLRVAWNNKWALTSTYGVSNFSAAWDVIWNGEDISKALRDDTDLKITNGKIDQDYLRIELKERKIYAAGGYQRAFNLATVVADILGWAAYGIEQYKKENYEFMGKLFGDAINKNFSRSVDFKAFEKEVLMQNNDHLARYLCRKNNVSPIRIIQWGETNQVYSVYQNGQFFHNSRSSDLRALKYVKILPAPPSC